MTTTLVDCGCEARLHRDGSGIEIDYCPKHAAAEDLLDALSHLLSHYDDVGGCIDSCRTAVIEARAAVDRARQGL